MPAKQEPKAPFRIVDKYPLWYVAVKWLLPISLSLMVGLTLGLAITGVLPIPAMMGKAAWLPAIYSSLDTFKAAGMLFGLSGAASAVVGLTSSFILRATVLFQLNEQMGIQAQLAQEALDRLHEKYYELDELYNRLHEGQLLGNKPEAADSIDSSSSLEEEVPAPVTPLRRGRRAALPKEPEAPKPKPEAKKGGGRKKAA